MAEGGNILLETREEDEEQPMQLPEEVEVQGDEQTVVEIGELTAINDDYCRSVWG